MKAHDLAALLLKRPNLPVIINGWGSDEGTSFQVSGVSPPGMASFSGTFDTAKTKRSTMGYISDRKCLSLQYAGRTPPSKEELKRERARKRQMAKDKKRLSLRALGFVYAEIKPLTPDEMVALGNIENKPLMDLMKYVPKGKND